jgi:hypothetical protein
MEKPAITRDAAIEERVVNGLKQTMMVEEAERLHKYHISDIMSQRQAVLKRKLGYRIDNTTALMFIAGQGHHVVIEKSFGEDELVLEYHGVVGTVDMKLDGLLHELKTSRTYAIYNPSTLPKSYPKQQRYYIAISDPTAKTGEGVIDVLHLCPDGFDIDGRKNKDPVLRCYRVQYSDLDAARAEIDEGVKNMDAVLKGEMPFSKLPLCEECIAYKRKRCAYVVECDKWSTEPA